MPFALTISEQTSPHPAFFAMSLKGRLVIPARGARTVLLLIIIEPIFIFSGHYRAINQISWIDS